MSAEPVKLSLALRKKLAEQEPNTNKFLEEIKKISGIDFVLDCNLPAFFELLSKEMPDSVQKNWPDYWASKFPSTYLEAFIYAFKNNICKDAMGKEALAGACTAKKIQFVIDKDVKKLQTAITDGVLILKIQPGWAWIGIGSSEGSTIGTELEKLL